MNDQVVAAVQRYVDAVCANDAAGVKASFREDAMMWGYLGENVVVMPAGAFADQVVATAPDPDPAYSSEIHSVSVTGGIATAILDERNYLGANFRNHFGLVNESGEWRIASKVFSTVP